MALFGQSLRLSTLCTLCGPPCLTLEMSTQRRVAFFSTNLHSFVSFGKTHKLHNAIDHWLAGVAGQAHVALDAVTEEERAVHTGHGGDRENKEVEKQLQSFGVVLGER